MTVVQPVQVNFYSDKVFDDFFITSKYKQFITYTFDNNDSNSILDRDLKGDLFIYAVYLGHK